MINCFRKRVLAVRPKNLTRRKNRGKKLEWQLQRSLHYTQTQTEKEDKRKQDNKKFRSRWNKVRRSNKEKVKESLRYDKK